MSRYSDKATSVIIGLISSSEPEEFKKGLEDLVSSSIPEQRGADYLLFPRSGTLGIQRKEFPHDFLKSVNDGRLARELSLLKTSVKFPLLIVEGRPIFSGDSLVIDGRKQAYSRSQIKGMFLSVKYVHDVNLEITDSQADTKFLLLELYHYFNKKTHQGFVTRPTLKSEWGTSSKREELIWFLQGVPGVGPGLAEKVVAHFNQKLPLRWTCTKDDFLAIKNIGKARATKLWEFLKDH